MFYDTVLSTMRSFSTILSPTHNTLNPQFTYKSTRSHTVSLTFGRRLRRRPNVKLTVVQRVLLTEILNSHATHSNVTFNSFFCLFFWQSRTLVEPLNIPSPARLVSVLAVSAMMTSVC